MKVMVLVKGDANYEAGAICMDEKLSREMEDQLTLDLVNSVPVLSKNEDHLMVADAARLPMDSEEQDLDEEMIDQTLKATLQEPSLLDR